MHMCMCVHLGVYVSLNWKPADHFSRRMYPLSDEDSQALYPYNQCAEV